MEAMEHAEAVSSAATERYVLGELTEAQCEAFEAHFFECPECASDVRAAAALVDDPLVFAEHEAPRAPGPARALLGSRAGRAPARFGRRLVEAFLPLPLGAAAALVLSTGAASWLALVALPDARGDARAARAEASHANDLQVTSSAFLSIARGEPAEVLVERGQRFAALELSSAERYPFYRCTLSDAAGSPLRSTIASAPLGDAHVQVLIPLSGLRAGRHALTLDGLASPDGPEAARGLARYEFSLRFRGE